ncbi:alpha/beta hydrolase [Brevibacterium sp. 91QC2O2]|uniref:alpha/beta fold hydrolase n=1 Tax=Brevibacterium sp. 91QC2O2 TaxID=2968458 RepID=UPI00211CF61F|nr:alpha/beta hydrolase [Brevibacterium sp. 91QC2O2]MCQ9369267.1 alpha/beta hydrolase [Brevibacterium sp. 91QC2O2]
MSVPSTSSTVEPPLGAPYDNASVAARLAALPHVAEASATTLSIGTGDFSAFRATPARPDESLGTAVLVHGWPEYASCWEGTASALLAAGMSILAYDQRGYSPGARPEQVEDYCVANLVADLAQLTAAADLDRFHLVGHDWGGIVAWPFAATHPERLYTCTVVSTSHPIAHGLQIKNDPDQYERMAYLRSIRHHPDGVARTLLRDGGKRLIDMYGGAVAPALAASYVERFAAPGAFDSTLKYYRALGTGEQLPSTPITVPTAYVWGSEDVAFAPATARLSGDYVEGPYTFVPLEGASHWLPESHPAEIAAVVLDLARRHAEDPAG